MDDLAKYGATCNPLVVGIRALGANKLVAKSIIFERELTPDEILVDKQYHDYTDAEKIAALEHSPKYVTRSRQIRTLEECGYSKPLAEYIVYRSKNYDLAYALGSQPELDMTVKVLLIFDRSDRITVPAGDIYPKDLYAQAIGYGRGL